MEEPKNAQLCYMMYGGVKKRSMFPNITLFLDLLSNKHITFEPYSFVHFQFINYRLDAGTWKVASS